MLRLLNAGFTGRLKLDSEDGREEGVVSEIGCGGTHFFLNRTAVRRFTPDGELELEPALVGAPASAGLDVELLELFVALGDFVGVTGHRGSSGGGSTKCHEM